MILGDRKRNEAWIEYGDGAELLLRYLSLQMVAHLEEKYFRGEKGPDPLGYERELYAYIVRNWRGVETRKNGKAEPLEFSVDNLFAAFDAEPKLKIWAFDEAMRLANFRTVDEAKLAGN